ncbi:hypothetical protein [Streptomyces sp. NBC_01304]|nr:hypothetical protein OG430_41395 [Streptomyces sp. NBC_01304]
MRAAVEGVLDEVSHMADDERLTTDAAGCASCCAPHWAWTAN